MTFLQENIVQWNFKSNNNSMNEKCYFFYLNNKISLE